METLTIPVLVDDRKDAAEFRMTRVSFYYVETLEPDGIPVEIGELGVPLLPIGYSAAIFRPPWGGEEFESAEQIEALFEAVERSDAYYVDADSLWIPNEYFDRPPQRSEIYRVPVALFFVLRRRSRGEIIPLEMEAASPDAWGHVRYSERETHAYAQWAAGILDDLIASYPKTPELKLSRK